MGIEAIIRALILEQIGTDIGKDTLLPDTDIRSIGIDSISFIKLIVAIEDFFGIEYPDDKLLLDESDTILKITDIVRSISNYAK